MAIHELKILPEFFQPLISGLKTSEIRKDDRGFRVGDELWLEEWIDGEYTDRVVARKISHIVNGGQHGIEKGYALLSLSDK